MKTKTCDRAGWMMLLAESGELGEAERRELALHLESCPACRQLQAANAFVVSTTRRQRRKAAPPLSPSLLEARAPVRLLPFRAPLILAAVAALLLALLGAGLWLTPSRPDSTAGLAKAGDLVDEWQFWLASAFHRTESAEQAVDGKWSHADLAMHLLALEGLLPDEEALFEEDAGENPTPGALPPISLRDCNTPAPLRS